MGRGDFSRPDIGRLKPPLPREITAKISSTFAIAVVLLRRPQKPGIQSMILMLFSLAVWSFSYALITLSPDHGTKLFWLRVENIGIQFVPVFWFCFAMKYTRMDQWLTGSPIMWAFFIIPGISLFFIFFNAWFHLYYTATHTPLMRVDRWLSVAVPCIGLRLSIVILYILSGW